MSEAQLPITPEDKDPRVALIFGCTQRLLEIQTEAQKHAGEDAVLGLLVKLLPDILQSDQRAQENNQTAMIVAPEKTDARTFAEALLLVTGHIQRPLNGTVRDGTFGVQPGSSLQEVLAQYANSRWHP